VLCGERTIRLLEQEQLRLARRLQMDMRRDEQYWREVAAQRGGDDVAFEWKPSMSNGYVVMGAIPAAIHKRAQVAHVGTER
jgi:hypothetical protein